MDTEIQASRKTYSGFMTKSFMWMAIALLVTTVFAIGGTLLLKYVLPVETYLTILIVTSVVQLILLFVIQFSGVFSKKEGSAIIPFMLYAVCTGFLLSSIVAFTDVMTILYALGATLICFGSMALVGYLSKANMKVVYMIAIGFLVGATLLTVFNFIFGVTETSYWVISYLLFGFILLITSVDVWRMKSLAQAGVENTNLAVYCAFQIYYDFIMIFIRVIQIFARNKD